MKFFKIFFSHFFVFSFSATALTLWLFIAGTLSKNFQYFLGAILVIVIYFRALTSKQPEIQVQDKSIETYER
jgi:hypothetical protein